MLSIWIFCFLIFSSRSAMILLPASSSCACFATRALSISNSSCSVMLFYSVLLIETAYHFSTFLSTVLRYLNPRKVLNFKAFQGFSQHYHGRSETAVFIVYLYLMMGFFLFDFQSLEEPLHLLERGFPYFIRCPGPCGL